MKQSDLLKELKKSAKDAFEKNKEIIDIILFGSIVRGKTKPKDIDVLILFNKHIDRTILKQFNLTYKTYYDFFRSFPTESILHEGFSLLHDKKLSEMYALQTAYLFRYSLQGKSKTQRMQFYYALHGRNTEGVLKLTKSKKFSDMTLLTPVEYADEIKEFFEQHKIEYFALPIFFPQSYADAERLSVEY